MSNSVIKGSKLAVMPVNKLMLNMGLPMIVSMMLQAVYNIVDSAFIANMSEGGEQALNALTLAFPVQMLMVAVGIGTGVGVNVLLSKSLGQGETERAGKTAGNGVFLMAVIYLCFLAFGIFGTKGYIATQTDNEIIADMAVDYLRICCCVSFGSLYFALYEKVLQATGKSMFSTIAQIVGALVNIVLDPIMIYGLLGCPRFGVKGAAYATVIGQLASALCGLILHLKYNKEIKNKLSYIIPDIHIIKGIYSIGIAAIVAQALMSLMTYLLNVIFVRVDENIVTAYGLYYKIQQFILFAAFGLRDAITPIVSFNYGMQDKKRVRDGIKYGMLYTLAIMLVGLIGLELLATPLAGMFGLSGETKALCISAMRIISLSFIFAGTNIAFQGIFQALDSGMASLVVSVCRQFLFVVPVAYAFTEIVSAGHAPEALIWFTFLIAEAVSTIIAMSFMKGIERKKIEEM